MKKYAIALAVFLAVVLVSSSEPATAGSKYASYPTYGWVYPVSDVETWKKDVPSTQDWRHFKDMVEKTHFAYVANSNETINRMQFQRALNAATEDGWTIVEVDVEHRTALLHKNKVELAEAARR